MSRGQRGQGTLDLLIMMFILVVLSFGIVHLALLAAARHTLDYAAFATARSAMVHGALTHSRAQRASREALRSFPWPGASLDAPDQIIRGRRSGVRLRYFMPMPTASLAGDRRDARGVPLEGFAVMAIQPHIEEEGDNGRR